jgi:hypothetical protein
MSNLIDQYSTSLEVKRAKPITILAESLYGSSLQTALGSSKTLVAGNVAAGRKRTSDEALLGPDEDKENSSAPQVGAHIPVQKRRKPGNAEASVLSTTQSSGLARTASKRGNAVQVLSPKSSNSRTYPHSPIHAANLAPPVPPKHDASARIPSPSRLAEYSSMLPPATRGAPSKTAAATTGAKRPASRLIQPISNTNVSSSGSGTLRGKRPAAASNPITASSTRTRAGSNGSESSTTTILTKPIAQAKPPSNTTTTTLAKKAGKQGIVRKVASTLSAASRKKAPAATTTVTIKETTTASYAVGTVRRNLRTRK